MCVVIIDGEWTVTNYEEASETSGKTQKWTDGSAYNPNNRLVSFGYISSDGTEDYFFFNHKEMDNLKHLDRIQKQNRDNLQAALSKAKMLVAHNIRADLSWLLECGFEIDLDNVILFDTMVFEYLRLKGMKESLKLAACCERHGLSAKLDVLADYFAKGYNTDEIPMDELELYGRQDIKSTLELFNLQKNLIKSNPEVNNMMPIFKTSCEFSKVLLDMERSGIKVDLNALDEVEQEYRSELITLEQELREMAQAVMGDTPVNLSSPEQKSQVLYSIQVTDKKKWADVFNIGYEIRNGVSKKKYPKRMKPWDFKEAIQKNSVPLYKTKATQCPDCRGTGKTPRKRNGKWVIDRQESTKTNEVKKLYKCQRCNASGIIYESTGEKAGFGIEPISSKSASEGGFATGGWVLDEIREQKDLREDAREFLDKLDRYNSVRFYLTNFVEGIRKNLKGDILHMSYWQTSTATGRLSSTFHNLPRGNTFPIKRIVVSRFKDGYIFNGDAGQLEFRTAALLSQCRSAMKAIVDKIDIHTFSATTLTDAGQPTDRQGAKAHTFKPLYGGTSGTEAEQEYYQAFLEWFSGIAKWQQELATQALNTKQIVTPSGRHYAFPYAQRYSSGAIANYTQMCNYPVQGFGFDIIMVVLIDLWKRMRKHALDSRLIITVHDSVTADVKQNEVNKFVECCEETFAIIPELVEQAYDIKCNVDMPWDLEWGNNWMEKKNVKELLCA